MLKGGSETLALGWIIAQPVEQLGKAPLGGIRSATPIDRLKVLAAGGFGDQRGFAPRAMVAPQIIFIERLKVCVCGNDAGAGGVDGEGGNLVAGDTCGGSGFASSLGEGAHVVVVALRGVVRVIFLAMQRILGDSGAETSALRVDDGDAYAQGAEICARYDGHEMVSKLDCTRARGIACLRVRVHVPAEIVRGRLVNYGRDG